MKQDQLSYLDDFAPVLQSQKNWSNDWSSAAASPLKCAPVPKPPLGGKGLEHWSRGSSGAK
jgi:hypothetical protein